MKFIVFYDQYHRDKKSDEITKEELGEYIYNIFRQGACNVKVVCIDQKIKQSKTVAK